jgi:hypothetical protein
MSPQTRAALGLGVRTARPAAAEAPPRAEPAPYAGLPAGLAVDMRVQRRLALRTMGLLLGGLLILAPALVELERARLRLLGVPLTWLLLGVAVYPALMLLAHRHRRAVDSLEAAMLERQNRTGA